MFDAVLRVNFSPQRRRDAKERRECVRIYLPRANTNGNLKFKNKNKNTNEVETIREL